MKTYLNQALKVLTEPNKFKPLEVARYRSPLKAIGVQFSALVFSSVKNTVLTGLKIDVELTKRCELSVYSSICLGDDDTAACLSINFFFLRFFIALGCIDYPPLINYTCTETPQPC